MGMDDKELEDKLLWKTLIFYPGKIKIEFGTFNYQINLQVETSEGRL